MANKRYQKYKDSYRKYRQNEKNKEKIKKLSKQWRESNIDKRRELGRTFFNRKRFGGNRETILEIDNWSCRICGMTNEQHIVIFGQRLAVDHIDGNENNISLNNLQTLCCRCHANKEWKVRKKNEVEK